MSLSYYNPNDRYRRRLAGRLAGLFVTIGIMGLSLGLGFWLGGLNAAQKINSLQAQLEDQRQQQDEVQASLTEQRAEAQTANLRYEQLQETYQETIPEGPMKDLVGLVRKQLEEGMDPKRLEFVIRSARPPRNCSEPETKRFVISTPANSGPENQIDVAEGAIIIKGTGVSARNMKGEAEAWYDPSKGITLEFIPMGGEAEKKAGVMPLHHSVVAGAREYRFTIEEGARSFAKVTFDSCDYP